MESNECVCTGLQNSRWMAILKGLVIKLIYLAEIGNKVPISCCGVSADRFCVQHRHWITTVKT